MTLSLAELKTGVKSRRMYFQSVGGITNMFWLYIWSVSELPAVNLVRKNCRSWKCSWSRTEMNPLPGLSNISNITFFSKSMANV